MFFVDAKLGRMICSHGSDNSASTLGSGLPCDEEKFQIYANGSEDLLYVMRTDYEIRYYPPDSKDILWQVAFADIEAEFQCQAFAGEYHLNSEPCANYIGNAGSTMPCGTRASVYRLYDDDLLGFLALQGKEVGWMSLPLPSGQNPSLGSLDLHLLWSRLMKDLDHTCNLLLFH